MSTGAEIPRAADRIEFLDHLALPLPSGEYRVQFTQTLQGGGTNLEDPMQTDYSFVVSGDRFQLAANAVAAVYPAPGSLGDHSRVLPHIVFREPSLPWQRESGGAVPNDGVPFPWLALLVFHGDEAPALQSFTLGQLRSHANDGPGLPAFGLEPGQHEDDPVHVIDVDAALLQHILPANADLRYTVHVRRAITPEQSGEALNRAVLLAGRLPVAGGDTTVHLVSLEGRLDASGDFDYAGGSNPANIRFVSLKTWSFACLSDADSLEGILRDVVPVDDAPRTLRSPANVPGANRGHVALPHRLRTGATIASYYHGPLLPALNRRSLTQLDLELPASSADRLLTFNPNEGIFDTAYAAAWTLGRLLMLRDKSSSVALYHWKKDRRRAAHAENQRRKPEHVHLPHPDVRAAEPPPSVLRRLQELQLLIDVPFAYLVPQADMLPQESLRLFYVDHAWIRCCLDGAMSVGRVSRGERQFDAELAEELLANSNSEQITAGFLLRSRAVGEFDDLTFAGYEGIGEDAVPCATLRTERLAADVMIGLFALAEDDATTSLSPAVRLDFFRTPDRLHSGFARGDGTDSRKYLRNPGTGVEGSEYIDAEDFLDGYRRLDLQGFAARMQQQLYGNSNPMDHAQFALQMIEGSPRLEFHSRDDGGSP